MVAMKEEADEVGRCAAQEEEERDTTVTSLPEIERKEPPTITLNEEAHGHEESSVVVGDPANEPTTND